MRTAHTQRAARVKGMHQPRPGAVVHSTGGRRRPMALPPPRGLRRGREAKGGRTEQRRRFFRTQGRGARGQRETSGEISGPLVETERCAGPSPSSPPRSPDSPRLPVPPGRHITTKQTHLNPPTRNHCLSIRYRPCGAVGCKADLTPTTSAHSPRIRCSVSASASGWGAQ